MITKHDFSAISTEESSPKILQNEHDTSYLAPMIPPTHLGVGSLASRCSPLPPSPFQSVLRKRKHVHYSQPDHTLMWSVIGLIFPFPNQQYTTISYCILYFSATMLPSCVCVCVCVWERERESDRESVCVCVCVCVCVFERERERERERSGYAHAVVLHTASAVVFHQRFPFSFSCCMILNVISNI